MTKLLLPQLTQPATAEQWFNTMLGLCDTLKLSTTDWEQGAPTRTFLAVAAGALMIRDVEASIIAQSGMLDYAATGSVTYTDTSGNTVTVPVTPDPSNAQQNPTGALGALDVLADAVYDVQRVIATKAGGVEALLNTSVSTYGPFAAGAYHVAQPGKTGSPGYTNTASLTIAPSTLTATVTGTSNAGGLVELTTTAHGYTVGTTVAIFVTSIVGTTEANGAWYATVINGTHLLLQGSAFVNAWVSGGNVYTPTLGNFTADNPGTASSAAAGNLVTQAVTSLVGITVANLGAWLGSDTENNVALAARCRLKLQSLSSGGPQGAYLFFALSAQQIAPTLTPPQAVSAAITRALSTADKTTGTVTTTIANAAGAPSGDLYPPGTPGTDVYAVGKVIDAFAVPLAVTSFVQAAAAHSIAIAVTVYVPAASATAVVAVVQVAVQAYFAAIPIGGYSDPAGPQNIVPINGVRDAIAVACAASNITLQDQAVTLDGGGGPLAANVQLLLTPVPEVAVLSNPTFTPTVVAV